MSRIAHRTGSARVSPGGLYGYAATFGTPSKDLGGYVEVIERGAFAEALLRSDPVALFNHDANKVLARLSSGTLRLREDAVGLRFEIPALPVARRDIAELIERGDLRGCSFSFTVDRDRYERRNGQRVRVVEAVRELFDISVVVFPAYTGTSVSLVGAGRSDPSWRIRANHRRRRLALAAVA